eukprot:TRINITY_DN5908_c0_g2_i1.p1 TRINITY_DN5908_c0_g2~~TRINITY_DN5908_c0_g2_i1.p1  ORF type:complete len:1227 (+),score=457.24 TRINITY_DN5908_c0_g2_i1:72-3752(+)
MADEEGKKKGKKGKKNKDKKKDDAGGAAGAGEEYNPLGPPRTQEEAQMQENFRNALQFQTPHQPSMNPPKSAVAEYIKSIKGPVNPAELTNDPRTNLPLLDHPAPHLQHILGGTGLDQCILHIYANVSLTDPRAAEAEGGQAVPPPPEDPNEATKTLAPDENNFKQTPMLLLVTDQTIMVVDTTPPYELAYCMQVAHIQKLEKNVSFPNVLGIKGMPDKTHRDFLFAFSHVEDVANIVDTIERIDKQLGQDDPLETVPVLDDKGQEVKDPYTGLPATYLQERAEKWKTWEESLRGNQIRVDEVKVDADGSRWRMNVPPMTEEEVKRYLVPQRSKRHLMRLMENYEKQEDEMLRYVEETQRELEDRHLCNMRVLKQRLSEELAKLEAARSVKVTNNEEIARLQRLHQIATAEQSGAGGDEEDAEELRERELESIAADLRRRIGRRALYKGQPAMAGNFFERDLEDEAHLVDDTENPVDPEKAAAGPAPDLPPQSAFEGSPERGLHPVPRKTMETAGLVEVLRGQAHQRNDEIKDLTEQVDELEKMRHELHKKNSTINNLKAQIAAAQNPTLRKVATLSKIDGAAGPDGLATVKLTDAYYPLPGETATVDGVPVAREPLAPFQKQPFEKQPFVSNIPKSADEIKEHPHTGLELVGVPVEFQRKRTESGTAGGSKRPPFEDLEGAVLQVFEKTYRYGKNTPDRCLIISDRHIYRTTLDGRVVKTMQVGDVNQIFTDNENGIGFRSVRDQEPDMFFIIEDGTAKRDYIVHVIRTIQKHLARAKQAQVIACQPGDQPLGKTLHTKGQSGRLHIPEVTTKRHLLQQLKKMELTQAMSHQEREKARESVHEEEQERLARMHVAQQEEMAQERERDDEYTRLALESLKADLRVEFQDKKDQEYQRLQDEIEQLERENAEREAELNETREKWRKHRCKVPKNRPNKHKQKTFSTGKYWVPTVPTEIECRLDVLHVQFWDNILITSHANGFLNVWDIDTGEHIKALKDHTAKVVAFQYDGVELISASFDSTIRRWNVADGSCINVIAGHRGHVTCLQFDRSILCTGSTDSTIQVWAMDVQLRNLNTLRGHKSKVECLRFERDVLVSVEWGWLFVWDLDQGLVTKALRDENGGITCLDFSAQFLVTGGQGGLLTLWDIRTGEFEVLEEHEDDITHVQVEGAYCVTSSADCTVRMWDLMQLKPLGVFNNSYPYPTTTFQFISNRFVAVEGKTVKIWTK